LPSSLRITSIFRNPAFTAALSGGASTTSTPTSAGRPAADASSRPTAFLTFAPSHCVSRPSRFESPLFGASPPSGSVGVRSSSGPVSAPRTGVGTENVVGRLDQHNKGRL
jgi:hypothetical protein